MSNKNKHQGKSKVSQETPNNVLDKMEFEGIVEDFLGNDLYRVRTVPVGQEQGIVVMCKRNGKMRGNDIRISKGDRVNIETSTYDFTKGRIVYRERS